MRRLPVFGVIALTSLVATLLSTVGTASANPMAGRSDQWTTFYDSGPLAGVGWAACPDPIKVSLDTPLYLPESASRFAQAITNAVNLWTRNTGLTFVYDGMIPVTYDDATGVTSPTDGIDRDRHIYFAVIPDKNSRLLDNRVVGLGAPSAINTGNHEIIGADVTFEYEYVKKVSIPKLTALFAHELGHALGLGHSNAKTDVMYPIVTRAKRLGAGDITGIQTITRPCTTSAPSRDYPLPQ